MPKYNYLDRDLQLPVQIHQNVQSYRDSPDEGELVIWVTGNIMLIVLPSRNFDPEVPGQQHKYGQSNLRESSVSPVRGATQTMSGPPQLGTVPFGAHYPYACGLSHPEATGHHNAVEGHRWLLPGACHVAGRGGSHLESNSLAQRTVSPYNEEAVCPALVPEMVD